LALLSDHNKVFNRLYVAKLMELKKFVKGKGIDASKFPAGIENAEFYNKEINNFYRLNSPEEYGSFDFVYSKDLINETKFYRILLREWSFFVKKGGRIIIEINNNLLLTFSELVKECELVLGDVTKIIEKTKTSNGGIIVLEKVKDSLAKGDSIDKWTFGILVDGTKEDAVERLIDSIISLDIPFFEIITVGTCSIKNKKNYRNISFEPKTAWITRKKNMIAEEAKYENLVIMHNRFVFDKSWFKGMKKYGNYFDVLCNVVHDPIGRRAGDWLTHGRDIRDRWVNNTGLLEYKDWDINLLINGSFYVMKKSAWKKCPWNERLVWGHSEDDELSAQHRDKGVVPRFNPFSKVSTFPKRYGEWHWKYKYNPKKLGKIPKEFSLKFLKRKIDRFCRERFGFGFVVKENYNTYRW